MPQALTSAQLSLSFSLTVSGAWDFAANINGWEINVP